MVQFASNTIRCDEASTRPGRSPSFVLSAWRTPRPRSAAPLRLLQRFPSDPGFAFLEQVTGRGYATEAGEAFVRFAREHAGMRRILSAVDEPNSASIRVLEKLHFRQYGAVPGHFGRVLLFAGGET